MVKAVIFDLWETVAETPSFFHKELAQRYGFTANHFFLKKYERATQLHAWNDAREMACGILTTFKLPHNKDEIDFLIKLILRLLDDAKPIDGMPDVLATLKDRHKLCLLSNTNSLASTVIERWTIAPLFDQKVYSWQVGAIKPDPRMFEACCERLGLAAEECLFIDDTEENVLAAMELGMQGVIFRGVKELRKALNGLGLLPPQ